MVRSDRQKREIGDNTIIYHFDIDEHGLPLAQFIKTALATKTIIDTLNKELFRGELEYQIWVVPPESGGLIKALKVVFLGASISLGAVGGAVVMSDVGQDFLKGFIEGATDYTPKELGEVLGSMLHEGLSDNEEKQQERIENFESMKDLRVFNADGQFDYVELEGTIFSEIVVHFLETETEELEKTGFTKQRFQSAYEAKNQVFEACIENSQVKGLGFERADNFPIQRSDFPRLIAEIPEYMEEQEETSWTTEVVELIANSPNWSRGGRKWQGKTDQYEKVDFIINDEGFWAHVDIKDIRPDIGDHMKVQWAYPETVGKPSKVSVLKVLKFNGRELSAKLSDDAVFEILGKFSKKEKPATLLDFSEEEDK